MCSSPKVLRFKDKSTRCASYKRLYMGSNKHLVPGIIRYISSCCPKAFCAHIPSLTSMFYKKIQIC